jgi:hypothetical protein
LLLLLLLPLIFLCYAGQQVPFYTRNYQEVDHCLGKGSTGKVHPAARCACHASQHCLTAAGIRSLPSEVESTGQTLRGAVHGVLCSCLLTRHAGGCTP